MTKKRGWAIESQGEYSFAWKQGLIQAIMYSMSGYTCEHCGLKAEYGTTRCPSRIRKDGRPYVMTVHHIDGNKGNNQWTNLLVCCQACHLSIQAQWGPGDLIPPRWVIDGKAPKWVIIRKLPYKLINLDQLKMFTFSEGE